MPKPLKILEVSPEQDLRAWLRRTPFLKRKCKGCGCMELMACPGGCGWARPEWCTTCELMQDCKRPARKKKKPQRRRRP